MTSSFKFRKHSNGLGRHINIIHQKLKCNDNKYHLSNGLVH